MARLASLAFLISLSTLPACTTYDNEFVVHDSDEVVSSAELRLCGRRTKLIRTENSFRTTVAITCEGSGEISIDLVNSGQMSCKIGYVTPGWETTMEYEIIDGQCSAVGLDLRDDLFLKDGIIQPQPFEPDEL